MVGGYLSVRDNGYLSTKDHTGRAAGPYSYESFKLQFFSGGLQVVKSLPLQSKSGICGQLINNPEFSDVVLQVEMTDYYAHKCILTMRSAYFRGLFASGLV